MKTELGKKIKKNIPKLWRYPIKAFDYCTCKDIRRNINRLWNAQEEMVNNALMLAKRMEKYLEAAALSENNHWGGVFASDNKNAKMYLKKPQLKENFLTLEQSMAELKNMVPDAYSVWIKLFNSGKQSYEVDPVHNLVVEGSRWEKTFDSFGKLYFEKPGYLLDIGCGPQPLPGYLRNFPIEYIYGMDPLLPVKEHPFKFMQNIAEFIPYKDEQFDYILSATSIDHVLLLDKALDEMHRVLKKDGVLLIWAAEVKGAKAYDPYKKNIKAVDKHHMFHIAPQWFEKLMEDKWDKESHYSDRYGSHFYAFRKK